MEESAGSRSCLSVRRRFFNFLLQELEGLSSRPVQRLRLAVTQQGELDALAVWFQLHLDEDNSLSTGPQEDTCWEQAIYPVHSAEGETHKFCWLLSVLILCLPLSCFSNWVVWYLFISILVLACPLQFCSSLLPQMRAVQAEERIHPTLHFYL